MRKSNPLLLLLFFVSLALAGLACNLGRPQQTASPTPTPLSVAQDTPVQTAIPTVTEQTGQASPTASRAASETPSLPVTGATQAPPSATSTSASPQCTVVQNLNVRPGPGTAYEPPITSVTAGTLLTPLGFNPNGNPGGAWLNVATEGGTRGWVSAGPAFVSCNVDFNSLPFVEAPPLPPTATPSPTPRRPVVSNPDANGQCPTENMVCELQLSEAALYRLIVRAVDGANDGDGIASVDFSIANSNGATIYSHTETAAAFCTFGGDGPCNPWPSADGRYTWGAGGPPVESGAYVVTITAFLASDPFITANWDIGVTVTVP